MLSCLPLRVASNERPHPYIEHSLPVLTVACAGQVECKRLVSTDANEWSSPCNYAGRFPRSWRSSFRHAWARAEAGSPCFRDGRDCAGGGGSAMGEGSV